MENKFVPPKFVKLQIPDQTYTPALRLVGTNQYYRDGGAWSISFKIVNGEMVPCKLYTEIKHLKKVKFIPIEEDEWRICNGEYAPKRPFEEDDDFDEGSLDDIPF